MAKSNPTRILTFVAAIALSGCATCERHPVECGAIVGFVATSVALSVNRTPGSNRHDTPPAMTPIPKPPTGPTTY